MSVFELTGASNSYFSSAPTSLLEFGSNDYTIEWYQYQLPYTQQTSFLDLICTNGRISATCTANSPTSDTAEFTFYNQSTILNQTLSLSIQNQWTHIAVVRSATTVRIYINGVMQLSFADSFPINGVLQMNIGSVSGSTPFTGYLKYFSVVNGVATYTSNFTPSPTMPNYSQYSNTFVVSPTTALPSSIGGATPTIRHDPTYVVPGQLVFQAVGGYSNSQTFASVSQLPTSPISLYNVTGAVEIQIPAAYFNTKLGVNNANLWDQTTMSFLHDTISIPAADFVNLVDNASNFISVGKLSSLYLDFSRYVQTYFGVQDPSGKFASLLSTDLKINANGTFGAVDLCNLMKTANPVEKVSAVDGVYNSALSGVITVSNITQLLRDAVTSNPFNNRSPPTNNSVTVGFLPNDLIFIPNNGLSITLDLVLDKDSFIDYFGSNVVTNPGAITNSYGSGTASNVSNNASILISRNVTAPLLLKLY